MSEDQLTEQERRLFDELRKEASPPPGLEKRIIEKLKAEDRIKNHVTMNYYVKLAASIAASLLLFFSGMLVERVSSPNTTIEPTMGYMMLLHEGPDFEPGDPMEMFTEYRDWMINTSERGVKITGQELKNGASLVRRGKPVENKGEEAKYRTTGYFIIEAESLDEALEVAKENPHVKYGGMVEVKPFMVR